MSKIAQHPKVNKVETRPESAPDSATELRKYALAGESDAWTSHFHNLVLTRTGGKKRDRTLAVARIMKAVVEALATEDDGALRELEKPALRQLQKRYTDGWDAIRMNDKPAHLGLMLEVGGAPKTMIPLGDIYPAKGEPGGRCEMYQMMRETVCHYLQNGKREDFFVEWFKGWIESPWGGVAVLAENGLPSPDDAALDRVYRAIGKAFRTDLGHGDPRGTFLAEAIIRRSLEAVGLPHSIAKNIFCID